MSHGLDRARDLSDPVDWTEELMRVSPSRCEGLRCWEIALFVLPSQTLAVSHGRRVKSRFVFSRRQTCGAPCRRSRGCAG